MAWALAIMILAPQLIALAASYSSKGAYIKFRIAFDYLVTRDALAWWEKW